MKKYVIKVIFILIGLSVFSCKEKTSETGNDVVVQDTIQVVDNQPEPDTLPLTQDNSEPITSIKKEFARINAAPLSKKTYTYQCDELITIDYYYEGENVVKAVVDYRTVGDHYQKSEFYYKDNKLLFFYDFVEGGPACEGCDMKLEQRYYVKDDLVIKYIKNQRAEKCTTCNFSERSTPYRALKAAKSLNFKTAFCS